MSNFLHKAYWHFARIAALQFSILGDSQAKLAPFMIGLIEMRSHHIILV